MEPRKLPNITLAIVLAILSYLCCCFGGLPGALLAGIALLILRKDEALYKENPQDYSNYSQLKTVRILAIIGLVLGILYFALSYYQIQQLGGWEAYMDKVKEVTEQLGIEN